MFITNTMISHTLDALSINKRVGKVCTYEISNTVVIYMTTTVQSKSRIRRSTTKVDLRIKNPFVTMLVVRLAAIIAAKDDTSRGSILFPTKTRPQYQDSNESDINFATF